MRFRCPKTAKVVLRSGQVEAPAADATDSSLPNAVNVIAIST